ncbi:MAG: hypothetical protein U0939_24690 [Pirellulales bacterium]
MAKKSEKRASASQAIRDYCKANPDAQTKDVAAKMLEMGFSKVTPSYVSTIRSLAKAKEAKGTVAPRKPGRPKASAAAASVGSGALTLETLLQAKELAAKLGGVAQAQAALDALAKLGA